MASPRRLVAAYFAGTLLLSSVSITREWVSPIDTPEGPWDWYEEVGVRDGVFLVNRYVPPNGVGGSGRGWSFAVHRPRFVPVPFLHGVGPESGGGLVAVWFGLGCVALAGHVLQRWARGAVARPRRRGDAGAA
jgi:hypothetical protein